MKDNSYSTSQRQIRVLSFFTHTLCDRIFTGVDKKITTFIPHKIVKQKSGVFF